MGDARIVSLDLDEQTVLRRSPEIEHERAVAIFDILEENRFTPVGHDGGPYGLTLSIEDRRLFSDLRKLFRRHQAAVTLADRDRRYGAARPA
jgi:uncharacterized protein (UPF0262 family)